MSRECHVPTHPSVKTGRSGLKQVLPCSLNRPLSIAHTHVAATRQHARLTRPKPPRPINVQISTAERNRERKKKKNRPPNPGICYIKFGNKAGIHRGPC